MGIHVDRKTQPVPSRWHGWYDKNIEMNGTCFERWVLADDALALDLIDQLTQRIEDAPVPRPQLHDGQWVHGAFLPLLRL